MPQSTWLHERAVVVGTIDPQTVSNSELFTDVIDMSKWHEVMAIALLGNMANETVTFTGYTCTSSGSSASAISGKSVALTASASANDNAQEIISVKSEEVCTITVQTNQYVKF